MDFDFSLQVGDVLGRACAHVVEDCDAISSGDEGICKVRADESGTTGDESAHGLSLSFEAGALDTYRWFSGRCEMVWE